MSVFSDTIAALSGTVPPLHQAVSNANQALQQATGHLTEALDHIAREYHQAISDRQSAQTLLDDAQRRVDEMQAAALHVAGVGTGLEKLIGVGQEVAASNEPLQQAAQDAPQVLEEVEHVVTEGQSAARSAREAVAGGEATATHE